MEHKDETTPATRADIVALRKEMREWHEDLKRHLDVVAENLGRELRGAFKDRTARHKDTLEDHERRLRKVERELLRLV